MHVKRDKFEVQIMLLKYYFDPLKLISISRDLANNRISYIHWRSFHLANKIKTM